MFTVNQLHHSGISNAASQPARFASENKKALAAKFSATQCVTHLYHKAQFY
ncbi:hypothetical protein MNBD_GAMMA11-542 [hydrothermal vent metagenome]|uniref:Uncharacterized protein n=1 Tax=hydrothermal vent metagenome TaxID=652676 RepID=A0A3B0X6V4_9ZZZZ